MITLPVIVAALCIYFIGYPYYSAFIAAKALVLRDSRTTPARAYEDGHNYVPSPKRVLFGHHFAAIAGAGVLRAIFIAGVELVVFGAAKRCWATLYGEEIPHEAFGPPRLAPQRRWNSTEGASKGTRRPGKGFR